MARVHRPEQLVLDDQAMDEQIDDFNSELCCPDCDRNDSDWQDYLAKQAGEKK